MSLGLFACSFDKMLSRLRRETQKDDMKGRKQYQKARYRRKANRVQRWVEKEEQQTVWWDEE